MEQDDEIAGEGNSYTTHFRGYDSRIVRWKSFDPKYTSYESPYIFVSNSPIYFIDPLGDFKRKFGARLYQLFHGGTIGQNSLNGEWFVESNRRNDVSGKSSTQNDITTLPNVIVGTEIRYDWKGRNQTNLQNSYWNNSSQRKRSLHEWWNSKDSQWVMPDVNTMSVNTSAGFGAFANSEWTLALVVRGDQPGLYYTHSKSASVSAAVEANVGFSIGRGMFISENVSEVDVRKTLDGQMSFMKGGFSTAFGPKIQGHNAIEISHDSHYHPTLIMGKAGVEWSVGIETPLTGEVGTGETDNVKPLIIF